MNPLEAMIARAKVWSGLNTLQDPTTGKPEESSSTLTVTPLLGERFVRLDYTWGYQEKPQEGSILIGFEPKSGVVAAHWIDTWHMGRQAMNFLGTSHPEGTIRLQGTFPAPPGPDWGWRMEIAASDESFRITQTCIPPEEEGSLAAEAVYSPSPLS